VSGGPYRIEVTCEGRRDLHRLPGKVAVAIIEFVTGPLAEDPWRLSKPLSNDLAAYRGARRGDYHVILRIDEDAYTVLVSRVGHRADIYRPR
jgi:mRNA interferase RelE/StbE